MISPCTPEARLEKRGLRLQPEQILADELVMRFATLELLRDGVDVAEASLERAILEDRVRAGQAVRGVDDRGRFVRGVGGGQSYGDLLVDGQDAVVRDGVPDLAKRLVQIGARSAKACFRHRYGGLDRRILADRALHAPWHFAGREVDNVGQARLRQPQRDRAERRSKDAVV